MYLFNFRVIISAPRVNIYYLHLRVAYYDLAALNESHENTATILHIAFIHKTAETSGKSPTWVEMIVLDCCVSIGNDVAK